MSWLKKLVAFLAMMAVLGAVLSSANTPLLAILVPILVLAGTLTIVSAHPQHEDPELPIFRFVPVLASRAPPSF